MSQMSPMRVMEGSDAIAEAVAMARPKVVAAYPITPQTHIIIVHMLPMLAA